MQKLHDPRSAASLVGGCTVGEHGAGQTGLPLGT
jgi:hypothetical protein